MSNANDYIEIHYYLRDNSHLMDAVIRNKAEKEFLSVIGILEGIFGIKLQIETQAYLEGGLIERFRLKGLAQLSTVIMFLSPAINDIIKYYFTTDNKSSEISYQINEETLKGLKLDNEKKTIELEERKRNIQSHVSKYYEQVSKCNKVEKVGFTLGDNEEQVIERVQFDNFIIDKVKETQLEDAEIEIISPVLKSGKYKWTGLFHGNKIDFSMGDNNFKNDIIHGHYQFGSGSTIVCKLYINTTYDEFGEEINKTYSVKEVYSVNHSINHINQITKRGYKKKIIDSQKDLFEDSINK